MGIPAYILSLLVVLAVVSGGISGGLPCGKFYSDGPSGKKEFALTYDDGPGVVTGDLLKLLKENNAKATFFITGYSVRARPEKAGQAAREGHLIANHTDTHINYYALKSEKKDEILAREIRAAAEAILKASGVKTVFLRMPNGYVRDWVKKVAEREGYVLVNWTYGSDWTNISEEKMLEGYLKHLRPGAILLFHDGGSRKKEKTLRITEKVLAEAKKKGLSPVRVDELLGLADNNNSK